MSTQAKTSLWKKLFPVFLVAGVGAAIVLWALFRPEKLFVNQKVNETASAAIANAQPLFTGSLREVAPGAEIHGRVNVLKRGSGMSLDITGLQAGDGPYSVYLSTEGAKTTEGAKSGEGAPAGAHKLGTVAVNATHESLPFGAEIDPATNKYVLLVNEANHEVAAQAELEAF